MALHRQRWRLHMNEQSSKRDKNLDAIKQMKPLFAHTCILQGILLSTEDWAPHDCRYITFFLLIHSCPFLTASVSLYVASKGDNIIYYLPLSRCHINRYVQWSQDKAFLYSYTMLIHFLVDFNRSSRGLNAVVGIN